MTSRLALGGLALALAVSATLPAVAAPPTASPTGVPTRKAAAPLSVEGLTLGKSKLDRLPAMLDRTRTVTALVQLEGDPVAVRRMAATGSRFDAKAAGRSVNRVQAQATPRLKAAGATVLGTLDTVLNAVRIRAKVADLEAIAAVPGVKRVQVARIIEPTNAAAESFTGVNQAWQSLGLTGKGMTIGIIDSGIDYTHADFGGAGTTAAYEANDPTVVEPGSFPTAKVVGGYDFVGDDYDAAADPAENPAALDPVPDADPLDCGGHGTHVAGTAAGDGVAPDGDTYAGPYNAATTEADFDVAPGVAPEASLMAYKVFGCEGSVDTTIISAAIDRAVADGVDVINMSLGSSFGLADDLETVAVDTATEAGVLVVASAGNSGPGAYLTGSPASATTALSVAAVNAEYASYPGVAITGAAQVTGLNANDATYSAPVTGQLVDVGLGCTTADYAPARGKIAVGTRGGTCARIDRAKAGQAAGALAVIQLNNAAGYPPFEGPIEDVSIPFVGIQADDVAAVRAALGETVTLADGPAIANPEYALPADFTSAGPRFGDSAQKPDIAAPGVDIPSANVGTGTGFIRYSGTSMAAPHTAGVAALVRQAHPGWSPEQTKAAMMSTAATGSPLADYDPAVLGTGLVQPVRAARARAYAWTSSGLNSLAFGMNQLAGAYAESSSFKITNESGRAVTYDLAARFSTARQGASVSVSPRSVRVPAGATVDVDVTMRLSRADVAALDGASASDGGVVNTIRGAVVATPRATATGVGTLRMTFLSVPVPLSSVTTSKSVVESAQGSLPPIEVRNTGVHEGTADVYQWLFRDPAGDVENGPYSPDVTNAGVQSLLPANGDVTKRVVVFSASFSRAMSSQSAREVDFGLDTDSNGSIDFVVAALDGSFVDPALAGVMVSVAVDREGNLLSLYGASAPANGSTVLAPFDASALGITSRSPKVTISAAGFGVDGSVDVVDGESAYNVYFPAVSNGDFVTLAPGGSASIQARVNRAQVPAQQPAGWLVVTPDDKAGLAETDRTTLTLRSSGTAPVARTGSR